MVQLLKQIIQTEGSITEACLKLWRWFSPSYLLKENWQRAWLTGGHLCERTSQPVWVLVANYIQHWRTDIKLKTKHSIESINICCAINTPFIHPPPLRLCRHRAEASRNKSELQPARWGVFHTRGVTHYAQHRGSLISWWKALWPRAGTGRPELAGLNVSLQL